MIVLRLGVDLSMTVFMLMAMAYYITGNTIHELINILILRLIYCT